MGVCGETWFESVIRQYHFIQKLILFTV